MVNHDDVVAVMMVPMVPMMVVVNDYDTVRHRRGRREGDSRSQSNRRDHFLQHGTFPLSIARAAAAP
jgi:hypothetical protein